VRNYTYTAYALDRLKSAGYNPGDKLYLVDRSIDFEELHGNAVSISIIYTTRSNKNQTGHLDNNDSCYQAANLESYLTTHSN